MPKIATIMFNISEEEKEQYKKAAIRDGFVKLSGEANLSAWLRSLASKSL